MVTRTMSVATVLALVVALPDRVVLAQSEQDAQVGVMHLRMEGFSTELILVNPFANGHVVAVNEALRQPAGGWDVSVSATDGSMAEATTVVLAEVWIGGSGVLAAASEPGFGVLQPDGAGGYSGYASLPGQIELELEEASEDGETLHARFTLHGTAGAVNAIGVEPDASDTLPFVATIELSAVPVQQP